MSFNFSCYDRAHLAASHEELNLANNLPSDIPDAALFMTSTTCVPSVDVSVHKPFYNATPPVKLLPVGAAVKLYKGNLLDRFRYCCRREYYVCSNISFLTEIYRD